MTSIEMVFWGGLNEQILISKPVTNGTQTLTFDVPGWASAGPTYVRLRLSEDGGLAIGGNVSNGEVEDHAITIESANQASVLFYPQVDLTPSFTGGDSVAAIDLDGDGDIDLAHPDGDGNDSQWLENDGNGTFTRRDLFDQWNIREMVATDFDSDGDVDLVYSSNAPRELGLLENLGNETFSKQVFATNFTSLREISVLDIEQDGDLDVLAADSIDDKLYLWRNDGTDSFSREDVASGNNVQLVVTGDIDRDGDLDIASNVNGTSWIEQTSSGFVTRAIHTSNPSAISLIDLDSDGDLDLVGGGFTEFHWYENDGAGNWTRNVLPDLAVSDAIAGADLDGDGDVDLVFRASASSQAISWYENDGSQNFTERPLGSISQLKSIATEDLDGDGDLDVAAVGITDGVKWFQNINGVLLELDATLPANGAFMVTQQSDLTLLFDQPIAVGSGQIRIKESEAENWLAEIDVQSSAVTVQGGVLTIDLPGELEADTQYSVSLDDGAVENLFGDPFEGLSEGEWEFRTFVGGVDYGDAPDVHVGSQFRDYVTRLSDGGPSHILSSDLYLGAYADPDAGPSEDGFALGDNANGIANDEDAFVSPLQESHWLIGATPSIALYATNSTAENAILSGWIDYDQDGSFDPSELAQVVVSPAPTRQRVVLDFPTVPAGAAGETILRLRLGQDSNATEPIGPSGIGEIEDHRITIGVPGDASHRSSSRLESGLSGIPSLSSGDRFGESIASVGDLDGDGTDDLAIGIPGEDGDGRTDRGAVMIALMNPDGSVRETNLIEPPDPFTTNNQFGGFIASAGDIDQDGNVDLYVFSPRTGTQGPSISTVTLGDDGGAISITHQLVEIDSPSNLPLISSFSPIGDVDGDGQVDFAIGEYRANVGGLLSGAAYVVFGSQDELLDESVLLANNTGGVPELSFFEDFGDSVAAVGDIDGDGIPDLAVGAPGYDGASFNTGAVYLLRLQRNGTAHAFSVIDGSGPSEPTLTNNAGFGKSIASVGDLNGDGVRDLLVGAYSQTTDGRSNAGQAHVLLLDTDSTVSDSIELAGSAVSGVDVAASELFGLSVSPAGDIDGDGRTDFAIGSLAAAEGTVRVVFQDGPQTPRVESLQLDEGENSRSQVRHLDVTFDTVIQHSGLQQAFAVTNIATNSDTPFSVTPTDQDGRTIVRIAFTPGEFSDGWYRLVVDASRIIAGGETMSGRYAFGQERADAFFQLYGDLDGDAAVGSDDLESFLSSYRSQTGDEAFIADLDFNNDGVINARDFAEFRRRMGRRI
ncbi:MAG: FG-GAP-like repeat-containing protein [Planctomycetota bacterium]